MLRELHEWSLQTNTKVTATCINTNANGDNHISNDRARTHTRTRPQHGVMPWGMHHIR